MQHMNLPMEIKSVGDKGQFSGYASIFGNIDLGGDVISSDQPFKEFVLNPEGKILMLYGHDAGGGFGSTGSGGLPIGSADVTQNSKGLKFDGQLVMDDPFCQRVQAHLKAKTLSQMSIGYDVLPGGSKTLNSGARELNALKLWEISVVPWGMNPKTSIDSVKSAAQVTNIREFEDLLRESGFSKSQAAALAGGGWKNLQTRRDSGEADGAKPILDYLSSLNFA